MHTTCAKKYYSAIYPEQKESFDQGSWKDSTSLQMFCKKCRVKCLFCKTKKHILGNDNIKIVACKSDTCTHWSYYLPRSSSKSIGCTSKAIGEID